MGVSSGIEPEPSRPQRDVQNLYTTRPIVLLDGFEPPLLAYQASTLPLCYRREIVARLGIEPSEQYL